MKTRIQVGTMVLVCAGLVGSGCDDVDQQFDCFAACDHYAECIDSAFDESDCADRCETNADNDPDFASKLDQCESCIDERSCTESVFQCSPECLGIVP